MKAGSIEKKLKPSNGYVQRKTKKIGGGGRMGKSTSFFAAKEKKKEIKLVH